MNRKDRTVGLICIGIGIGMWVTVILLFSLYVVYLDIVTSEERLGIYYEGVESDAYYENEGPGTYYENEGSGIYYDSVGPDMDEPDMDKKDVQALEIVTGTGDTVIRIETSGDIIISEDVAEIGKGGVK